MNEPLGIIGYPIRHSISPIFQQAALDYHKIGAVYQAWGVAPEGLAAFMEELRSPNALGINVTVPYKEAVIGYLDHVDDWARSAGAVNTIVNLGGRLLGYNTDGLGFLRALKEIGNFDPAGCRALLLGAGGSAKGVALALAGAGASHLTIANRTLSRAEELAGLVRTHNLRADAIAIDPPDGALAAASYDADLIINCTTLGMLHGQGEAETPLSKERISAKALVYDLVYNPPETPLLREAALAGAASLGGLHMLVYQGAASFELWTGKEAPIDIMWKAAEAALG